MVNGKKDSWLVEQLRAKVNAVRGAPAADPCKLMVKAKLVNLPGSRVVFVLGLEDSTNEFDIMESWTPIDPSTWSRRRCSAREFEGPERLNGIDEFFTPKPLDAAIAGEAEYHRELQSRLTGQAKPANESDSLVFVTLSSGHSYLSRRSEVYDTTMGVLLPCMPGGGRFPSPVSNWYFEIEGNFPRGPEVGLYQFEAKVVDPGGRSITLSKCTVCWESKFSETVWDSLVRQSERSGTSAPQELSIPIVPWLAADLQFTLHSVLIGISHPAILSALADLERCVAWVSMEYSKNSKR